MKVENGRGKNPLKITFLPSSEPILTELSEAQSKYDQAIFSDFTEEELIQYAHLNEKIKQNTQKILSTITSFP